MKIILPNTFLSRVCLLDLLKTSYNIYKTHSLKWTALDMFVWALFFLKKIGKRQCKSWGAKLWNIDNRSQQVLTVDLKSIEDTEYWCENLNIIYQNWMSLSKIISCSSILLNEMDCQLVNFLNLLLNAILQIVRIQKLYITIMNKRWHYRENESVTSGAVFGADCKQLTIEKMVQLVHKCVLCELLNLIFFFKILKIDYFTSDIIGFVGLI